jgi:hypothetical protein
MAKPVVEGYSDKESSEVKPTEEQRLKKAYKWYKHNAKPTKNNMRLIVDALGDTGILREDIDLLPWNPDNTKVNKEELKAMKEKNADETDEADKGKDKKKKEVTPTATPYRSNTEIKKEKEKEEEKKDVFPTATPYRSKTEKKKDKEKAAEKEKKDKKDKKKKDKKAVECSSKEEKQDREDSLTSLDISQSSNRSSDADLNFTRHDKEKGEYDIGSRVYADQDEQHRMYEVEEEHKRKKEKRRREKEERKKKSELAKQKSKAEADERDKKEKDKKATEFASREPKFFAKRQEPVANYDSGVEDFTKFECKNVEFAQDIYSEQKRAYSVNEELERKREELGRKKEERRRLREEAKEKSMPKAKEVPKARQDDSLELAFKWYTRMAMPGREEFKRQIEIQRINITAEDVDLLEWNATGTRVTNISAMNNKIRTRMLKEATKAPASQRRRQ